MSLEDVKPPARGRSIGLEGGEIHTVSAPWDELTITHLTKPAPDATVLSSVAGPITPSETVDYDVSSAVTGNPKPDSSAVAATLFRM